MNYKGNKYDDTMEDFKKWCKDFPPLEVGEHRHYYKEGDYYMSLEVCGDRWNKFVGLTLRVHEDDDFELVDVPNGMEKKALREHLHAYEKCYGVRYYGDDL